MFEVRFFGPTINRGSRIKIIDLHRSTEKETVSVTMGYDYSASNSWEQAEAYLTSLGIKVRARAGSWKRDYLVTDDFKTDLVKGGGSENGK